MQPVISSSKFLISFWLHLFLNPANQAQPVSSEEPPPRLVTLCLATTELDVSAFWHTFLDLSAIGSFFTTIARYYPGNSAHIPVLVFLSCLRHPSFCFSFPENLHQSFRATQKQVSPAHSMFLFLGMIAPWGTWEACFLLSWSMWCIAMAFSFGVSKHIASWTTITPFNRWSESETCILCTAGVIQLAFEISIFRGGPNKGYSCTLDPDSLVHLKSVNPNNNHKTKLSFPLHASWSWSIQIYLCAFEMA